MRTLDEARAWLRERIEEGARCPCCSQRAQVYKRHLNAGMTRSLIQMYKASAPGFDYVHVPTVTDRTSREEGKLAYFGLIEEERAARPDGGRTGYWRVTSLGQAFVLGHVSLPHRTARVYDDRVLGFQGKSIDIRGALKKKFNYDELMAGI